MDPDAETGGLTMKRLGLVFLLIMLTTVFTVPSVSARDPSEITSMVEDGDITNAGGGSVKDKASTTLELDTDTNNRAYLEFNTSEIPATAIITAVSLQFRTATVSAPGANDILIGALTLRPSVAANAAVYADIATGMGTPYYLAENVASNTEYTMELTLIGNWAIDDLQAHLTWFGVGMYVSVQNDCYVHSSESAYVPVLIVEYYLPTDSEYHFTDVFYENGTHYTPSIEVTATGEGFNNIFNTSGGSVQYYPVEPEAFYWAIGSDLRYLYNIGEENFTITMPDDADYVYSFTVKDYTSKTPEYLEAYRTINGTSTLITRDQINQPNVVPLNLVYGKTYRLRILYADGSRYDWGLFVAGTDATITLILRTVTFTDQVQIILNDVFVEATRSTDGGTLTVDYNDTLINTDWANVTIRIRNGAIVATQAYNNESYTFNWASANASLGYVVSVAGEHGDYGTWGYVKIFDPDETYPDAPSLEGIFDLGLGANFGGWITLVATVIIFSKVMQGRALIAGMVIATLTNYIGFSVWTEAQILFGWFLAIVVALTTGGNE